MVSALRFLRFLLLPFSWLYGLIIRVRNYLYDVQYFKSYQAPVPVICVGNLTVGGTGKTPQVEYLARLLQEKNIAILSRGYKRATKGFVLGDATANAQTLGDEPFQYLQSLPHAKVAVCEKRVDGIQKLLALFPDLDLILLDDAFQHRAVKASFYLLLTDYGRLFTKDNLLPAGRLREPRSGAMRADAVVVTKCPGSLTHQQQETITQQVHLFSKAEVPVFFSRIRYGTPVGFGSSSLFTKRILLVTGIANAAPLVSYLQEEGYAVLRHFEGADHAEYSKARIEEIYREWERQPDREQVPVFMTQKDAVKWQQPGLETYVTKMPLFYLPIVNEFWPHVPAFDDNMRQALANEGFHINS
ncbi:tetraacyldisaccharide 4'-kinase [Nibribacter ruber]|uniref:Tetraacyldisaccharide 4'-kinase n=1 Tax=Nibribacter ruber TaxID=2698458 RepID=A0A6P1NVV3_9BACT|nr:tetraacyldisaccharide 4'-kinase [Nibribacter ruber]QHL86454.1 tetraacyldisaccharide 4'-kinase [Nibribacter ruber]